MTELEKLANLYRKEHITKNLYATSNEYSDNNKNALSDGDEKGKGENNGSIGSSVDIQNRIANTVKNKFSPSNEYSSVNANALSDGDEFGKGTGGFLDTSNGGSSIDKLERINEIKINEYQKEKPYTTPSA